MHLWEPFHELPSYQDQSDGYPSNQSIPRENGLNRLEYIPVIQDGATI